MCLIFLIKVLVHVCVCVSLLLGNKCRSSSCMRLTVSGKIWSVYLCVPYTE